MPGVISAIPGPWAKLLDEGQRLQILNEMGRYDEVLEAVGRLRDQMRSLPAEDQDGMVELWNVMELILGAGLNAAILSEKGDLALGLNAEVREVTMGRGATDLELALIAFYDYGPLLELEHYDDAEDLLQGCQEVFERENSIEGLSMAFSALAELEHLRGHLPKPWSL